MTNLERCCLNFTDSFCKGVYYACCPIRMMFKIISRFFQRPYSFCFSLNFFLLMFPAILIFLHEEIKQLQLLTFFIITLTLLGLNYLSTFFIYTLYQEHSIKKENENKSLSSAILSKKIRKYISKHKIIYLFILLNLISLVCNILSLVKLSEKIKKKRESFEANSIIRDFLLFGNVVNLIYSGGQAVLYVGLVVVLNCAVRNSCCCSRKKGGEKELNANYTKLHFFLQILLEMYKFSIYCAEKFLDPRAESRNKTYLIMEVAECKTNDQLKELKNKLHATNESLKKSIDNHQEYLEYSINPRYMF